MEFNRGDIVKHVLTGEELLVIKKGREQVQCRTNDYREVYFYETELAAK